MSYMEICKDIYERKYEDGYGINYPEGHVIRIFNYIRNKSLLGNMEDIKILDFGCGNGTHSKYFESKGWETFGVDISERAIDICKQSFNGENYTTIQPGQSIIGIFKEEFDIIFANQSLYYLTDTALNRLLNELYEVLAPGGIVVFTMMGSQNYYYNLIDYKVKPQDGLNKVQLGGRLEDEAYINFVESEEELVKKFGIFNKVLTGYYDFSMEEGSSYHYYFIGQK